MSAFKYFAPPEWDADVPDETNHQNLVKRSKIKRKHKSTEDSGTNSEYVVPTPNECPNNFDFTNFTTKKKAKKTNVSLYENSGGKNNGTEKQQKNNKADFSSKMKADSCPANSLSKLGKNVNNCESLKTVAEVNIPVPNQLKGHIKRKLSNDQGIKNMHKEKKVKRDHSFTEKLSKEAVPEESVYSDVTKLPTLKNAKKKILKKKNSAANTTTIKIIHKERKVEHHSFTEKLSKKSSSNEHVTKLPTLKNAKKKLLKIKNSTAEAKIIKNTQTEKKDHSFPEKLSKKPATNKGISDDVMNLSPFENSEKKLPNIGNSTAKVKNVEPDNTPQRVSKTEKNRRRRRKKHSNVPPVTSSLLKDIVIQSNNETLKSTSSIGQETETVKKSPKVSGFKNKLKNILINHSVPEVTEDGFVIDNVQSKSSSKSNSKDKKTKSLRQRMIEKLKGARFRYLNEQMYSKEGKEAKNLFNEDPTAFNAYHDGYRQQVSKWPLNPLDIIVQDISGLPKEYVVADLGCGDGRLSKSVPQKVYSFDLVSLDPSIQACDMSHTPLLSSHVNVAVFCLSLMGTNLMDYIIEANRILKTGGLLKIAEVESRFDNVDEFLKGVEKYGFSLIKSDLNQNLFYFMDFKKQSEIKKRNKLPQLTLKPCLYKKR